MIRLAHAATGTGIFTDDDSGLRFATTLFQPLHGPWMVSHPLILGGRPTSLWDVLYRERSGENVDGRRALPRRDDGWSYQWTDPDAYPRIGRAYLFDLKTPDELHDEAKARAGRPPKFSAATAAVIRTDYWNGKFTIREMSLLHGVSETAIARVVHGHTYWYV